MHSFGCHEVQLVSRFVVDKPERVAGSSILPRRVENQNLSLNRKDVGHARICVSGYSHLHQENVFAAGMISSKFPCRGRII